MPFAPIGFSNSEEEFLKKVADHTPARATLYGIGTAAGVLVGDVNVRLGIDMPLNASVLGLLLLSILIVVLLHEGLHGIVAALLGHKPLFGIKPPHVYVTFTGKLPQSHYMLVAIAPFVLLNLPFGFLYIRDILKSFCHLSLIVNSIGSIGDLWVTRKLAGGSKGAWIQDTKSGFEVWVAEETSEPNLANRKEF